MNRREALKRIGTLVGGAVVAPNILLTACARPEARSVQSPQPGRTPAADAAKPREVQKQPKTELIPYKSDNKELHYEISYPRGWVAQGPSIEKANGWMIDVFTKPGYSIQKGEIGVGANIEADPIQPGTTADEYGSKLMVEINPWLRKAGAKEAYQVRKQQLLSGQQAVIIGASRPPLAGLEAYESRYVAFVAGSKGYLIHFYADPKLFEENLPVFEEMLETFKLTQEEPGKVEAAWGRYTSITNWYRLDVPSAWHVAKDPFWRPGASVVEETFDSNETIQGGEASMARASIWIESDMESRLEDYARKWAGIWRRQKRNIQQLSGGNGEDQITIDGQKAVRLTILLPQDVYDRHGFIEHILFFRNGRLWHLKFYSDVNSLTTTRPIFDKMRTSFKFLSGK